MDEVAVSFTMFYMTIAGFCACGLLYLIPLVWDDVVRQPKRDALERAQKWAQYEYERDCKIREGQRKRELQAKIIKERQILQERVKSMPALNAPAGYVYMVQDMTISGFYKIGRTSIPGKRICDFVARWPFEIELVHVIETANCVALESQLHHRFASKRRRGEWFELDADDVELIRNWAVG